MGDKIDIEKKLEALSGIAAWFDDQEEANLEDGFKKVQEAAKLIKECNGRLQEIENKFEEIKQELSVDEFTAEDEDDPAMLP